MTNGPRRHKETWWWNEEVAEAVREKKIKYGKWKRENTKEARMEYKKSRQNAKRVISSAQEKKQKECANDLNLCNCIVKEGSIPEHKWRTSQGETEGCKMAMWGLQ